MNEEDDNNYPKEPSTHEYYVKVYATSVDAISEALWPMLGQDIICSRPTGKTLGTITGFYVLTEDGKSLAHLHTDQHMFVERQEATELAEFLDEQNTCCG